MEFQRDPVQHAQASLPAVVHAVLKSPGRPLDRETRAFFEPRFGHDFSRVRVHSDAQAGESARAVNALAYTVGHDIVFDTGKFAPHSVHGKHLLAHELTHVVQQQNSSADLTVGRPTRIEEQSESEAEKMAQYALADRPVHIQQSLASGLARFGHDVTTCKEEDLKNVLWPGDYLARQWLGEAIADLGTNPLPPYISRLFKCYFMTETPDIGKIKSNLNTLQARFQANDYFYTCKEDCAGTKEKKTMGGTYVSRFGGGSGPIVLCMNNLRTAMKPDWQAAQTIIHEFSHRYLNFFGDTYCDSCCSDISADDALKNPDSYGWFVWELHFEKLKALRKASKP
jgi:hypothetical protein